MSGLGTIHDALDEPACPKHAGREGKEVLKASRADEVEAITCVVNGDGGNGRRWECQLQRPRRPSSRKSHLVG